MVVHDKIGTFKTGFTYTVYVNPAQKPDMPWEICSSLLYYLHMCFCYCDMSKCLLCYWYSWLTAEKKRLKTHIQHHIAQYNVKFLSIFVLKCRFIVRDTCFVAQYPGCPLDVSTCLPLSVPSMHAVREMSVTWCFTSVSFCLYCLNDASPCFGFHLGFSSLMPKHELFPNICPDQPLQTRHFSPGLLAPRCCCGNDVVCHTISVRLPNVLKSDQPLRLTEIPMFLHCSALCLCKYFRVGYQYVSVVATW